LPRAEREEEEEDCSGVDGSEGEADGQEDEEAEEDSEPLQVGVDGYDRICVRLREGEEGTDEVRELLQDANSS
jgi:hypothetical protein